MPGMRAQVQYMCGKHCRIRAKSQEIISKQKAQWEVDVGPSVQKNTDY